MLSRLYSTSSLKWPSSKIREEFFNFFKLKGHKLIPSSSVIPKKDDGSYFVNAGMNQFKPIFLGTANANYKTAVNSQKCIRIGGKHNDLEEVGRDHYHHTFFEMLGNWSFNDYFKKEACIYAWNLLTKIYKLDPSRLYFTYFKGLPSLGIEEDLECFQIWKDIGVPESHIIGHGYKDNFWLMGDTGPCGPCSEIHYSKIDGNVAHLVNSGSPDVMEIWNIVFMQYDKKLDGSVTKLKSNNIDTGMGLERLTAILQNKNSNYETDLFLPILHQIQKYSGCPPYSGLLDNTIDIAYRIIADHSRMFTVTISDGLLPGRKESENKLRSIIYRSIHESIETLKSKSGLNDSLVPIVANILGNTYPEINSRKSEVQLIIGETEEKYLKSIKMARKILTKAISHFNSPKILNAQQILSIQEGKFGGSISYDFIKLLAKDFHIVIPAEKDLTQYLKKLDNDINNKSLDLKNTFNKEEVEILLSKNIQPTDDSRKYDFILRDSKYEYRDITSKIVAIRDETGNYKETISLSHTGQPFTIFFNQTNFFSECGGQTSDIGVIKSKNNEILIANIFKASSNYGYVSHLIKDIKSEINVGDEVLLSIDADHRNGCMLAHTSTHILNFCLNKLFLNVHQHGSKVASNHLTFEFICSKSTITIKDIEKINFLAAEIIEKKLEVSRSLKQFEDAICVPNIAYLSNEIYPKWVNVVSIHDSSNDYSSAELCAGTHVTNTSHIGQIVITNLEGSIQGSKKLVAVTGTLAKQALLNAEKIKTLLNKISKTENGPAREDIFKEINIAFSSGILLPKVFREEVLEQLKTLEYQKSSFCRKLKISHLETIFQAALEISEDHIISIPYEKNREMVEILVKLALKFPVFVISSKISENNTIFGLAYIPQNLLKMMSVTEWVDKVCQLYPQSRYSSPKAKFSKYRNICLFSIPYNMLIDKGTILQRAKQFKTVSIGDYKASNL